jgi:predicted ATPase
MTESATEDGTVVFPRVPFISRVRLKNYKSIAECDVRLGPLTILVGPNGSGKSNFLDALAFLSRAVATSPAEAIDTHGGLSGILRRVPDQASSFSIAIDVAIMWGNLPDQRLDASYGFEIGRQSYAEREAFEVLNETCELRRGGEVWRFRAERGRVEGNSPQGGLNVGVFGSDRLYLLVAGTDPSFAPLFAGLRGMQFYNFEPEVMRPPQPPTTGEVLGRTGAHLGDVLGALDDNYKRRVDAYLRAIVPGIVSLDREFAGQYVTFVMRAKTDDLSQVVKFGSASLSDGTIRAAGVLAALFQPWVMGRRTRLVGIEEPEIALHPAAAGVLFDALTEASGHVQVVATSQSADLLDREGLDVSVIRPVAMRHGLTVIGEVDDASREIVEKKLYTLGELMRGNQLMPGGV